MQYLRFGASQCAGRHITCQQYQSDALCRLRHRVAHGFSGDPVNLCSVHAFMLCHLTAPCRA